MAAYMPKAKSVEWNTPTQLKIKLIERFGVFDLDAATTKTNPMDAKAIITKEEDALAMSTSWKGKTVYLNPPYGRIISLFIRKAIFEYEVGNANKIVMLLPSRTCTKWFHLLYNRTDVKIEFIKGRLKYNDADSAPFPSMLVILG